MPVEEEEENSVDRKPISKLRNKIRVKHDIYFEKKNKNTIWQRISHLWTFKKPIIQLGGRSYVRGILIH
jgi:hypothetical protein